MKRKISILLVIVMLASLINVLVPNNISEASTATNIALSSKGATISSNYPTHTDWIGAGDLENMIDGQYDNFGLTDYTTTSETTPVWLEIQFDEIYSVSEIALFSSSLGGFPSGFQLEAYSINGWEVMGTWENLEIPEAHGQKYSFGFNAVDCSAIRMTTTKNRQVGTEGYGVVLSEFEVYGTEATIQEPQISGDNIALSSKGATVSSNYPTHADWVGAGDLENMIDGKFDNFGLTDYTTATENTPVTLTIQYDKTYSVSGIRLYSSSLGGFPEGINLEVYAQDGWQAVGAWEALGIPEGHGQEYAFGFDAIDCSAIRLTTTKNRQVGTEGYGIVLSEFEVYGETATSTVPMPPATGGDGGNTGGGNTDGGNTGGGNTDGGNTGGGNTDGGNTGTGGSGTSSNANKIALTASGVKISSNYPTHAEWIGAGDLEKMIDGNYDNFGLTDYTTAKETTPIELAVQFDKAYKLSEICLYSSSLGGFPGGIKLEAYTSNGWKTVGIWNDLQVPEAHGQKYSFKFSAVDCSTIRLTTTKNRQVGTEGYGLVLAELEVYGETATSTVPMPPVTGGDGGNSGAGGSGTSSNANKIALTASGVKISSNYPTHAEWIGAGDLEKMIDGNYDNFGLTDYTTAKETTPIELAVQFDKAYKLSEICLYSSSLGGFPGGIKLEAYTSNGWKTVGIWNDLQVPEAHGQKYSFKFSAVDCSTIRLTTTKNRQVGTEGYGLVLAELEVYGQAASSTVAFPTIGHSASQMGNTSAGGFTYNAEKNLALYVPVTAHSNYEMLDMGPEKLTDGDLYSLYSCDLSQASKDTPEWVEVNLLKNYAIDTVVLYARDFGWGFPTDFTISVFYDDEWIEVVNKTGYSVANTAGVTEHVFKFPATIGNQIRIEGTNFQLADGEYGLQLMEVAVYGETVTGNYILPNNNIISAGTNITTSSTLEDYNFFAIYLKDGDTTTGYSSQQHSTADNEEWIELDFGRAMSMGALRLKPAWGGNGFPVDFNVQLLVDGKWITALTVEDYKKPIDEAWQEFLFDQLYEASKLRITVTELGEDFGQYCVKLNEIEVYPYATDYEDNGAVEVVNSEKPTYNAAEKVSTQLDIPIGLIVLGATLIVMAITGGVFAYIVTIKKMKRYMK